MLPADEITRIALRETDGDVTPEQQATFFTHVRDALDHPETIPAFNKDSRPLTLVRFRALLQDTGYPAEVYLPPDADGSDWSQLRERWVGWAVEIPGEQSWAKHAPGDLSTSLSALSLSPENRSVVKDKHPTLKGTEYTGALVKVYDDFSPSPSSAYDVVGIVSTAPMPTSLDDDEPALVPAIHALTLNPIGTAPRPSPSAARATLLQYLANAFSPPDEHAAELLLLALLARPAVRPPGHPPLGTFALNLVRPRPSSDPLCTLLASLTPAVVHLPLTLPLLHAERFRPKSDGAALEPGMLQLAPGTLLIVDEDGFGGGALNETALRNLQALRDAVEQQAVNYEYPYMDGVRIECSVRAVVSGEGKSLLPCDVVLPVSLAQSTGEASEEELGAFRQYLAEHGGAEHAAALTIPEAVASAVQDRFVEERRVGRGTDDAEGRLKRRMKIARLLALSYPEAELTEALWARALELDDEIAKREAEREAERREGKLGEPNGHSHTNGHSETNGH
ncbi:hypothetical protein CspeluHIS016_0309410 [Cutaneotrichosporon spelunceum]|uniref:Uncharacterized protein n=1 Tax=Cutaneotrichosporon spelunceum TaxID=1672016 RepID=A0AAD3TUD9_9TREE|nr:hypothetical protein CspeluHIS016_0309410 [Cutaneotrichosporon spelunceum]